MKRVLQVAISLHFLLLYDFLKNGMYSARCRLPPLQKYLIRNLFFTQSLCIQSIIYGMKPTVICHCYQGNLGIQKW